jgi:hypothetical protein
MTPALSWLKAVSRAALGPRRHAWLATRAVGVAQRLDELRWALGAQGRANRQRLAALENAFRGRRCFIIGGGPSVAAMDLAPLRDEVTIGSNAIFLLFERMGFRPTFYTVEDRLVAEDRTAEINALRGTTKLLPRALSYCLTHDERTVWVNFVYEYEGAPRFSADLRHAGYWGGTVTFFNLQLAFFLGFREVYLLGIDHSYQVPARRSGNVITSSEPDVNHFHPDYFGPGYRWHDPRVERMEAAYLCAREFASHHGMAIINATVGGRLEVFPRVDFAELFRRGESSR